MDDIGPAPFEALRIEVFIHQQLKDAQLPEYIADELLKRWDASQLLFEAKHVVARFCLLNGFFPSLLRILKLDLRSGKPLPWAMVLELFYMNGESTKTNLQKPLADAILTGATRDRQLHPLAAEALSRGENDSRWKNILDAELKDRLTEVKLEREKLFKEAQIFKSERMDAEVERVLNHILTLFPGDHEAQELLEKLGDQELDLRIDKLKQHYKIDSPFHFHEEEVKWPELDKFIKKIGPGLSVEEAYLLSIALFQMEVYSKALEVLRLAKDKWKIREKLWEVELLLVTDAHAEALSAAQILLNQNRSLSEIVKATLYFSAKAYHGLGDSEQALSILKGIQEHDPYFRDTTILIVEWQQ